MKKVYKKMFIMPFLKYIILTILYSVLIIGISNLCITIFFSCRSTLKLESLEDAVVLENEEHDLLSDKHGCPAYVSPEILRRDALYSGRAADMWGLGVMLYTMLVGR